MQEVTGSSPVSPTNHRFRTQDVPLPIVADVMTGGWSSLPEMGHFGLFLSGTDSGGWSTSGQPSYSGRFTNWFGGNIGANGQGFWSTFSLTAWGSDGSVIHFNGVTQFHYSNGELHVDFTLENCRD